MNEDELSKLVAHSYRDLLTLLKEGARDKFALSSAMNESIAEMNDADAEQFIVHFGVFCFMTASESIRLSKGSGSVDQAGAVATRIAPFCCSVTGMSRADFIDLFGLIKNGDESASRYAATGIIAAVVIDFALDSAGAESLRNKLPALADRCTEDKL